MALITTNISNECWQKIFNYLDDADLFSRVARVCKHWKSFTEDSNTLRNRLAHLRMPYNVALLPASCIVPLYPLLRSCTIDSNQVEALLNTAARACDFDYSVTNVFFNPYINAYRLMITDECLFLDCLTIPQAVQYRYHIQSIFRDVISRISRHIDLCEFTIHFCEKPNSSPETQNAVSREQISHGYGTPTEIKYHFSIYMRKEDLCLILMLINECDLNHCVFNSFFKAIAPNIDLVMCQKLIQTYDEYLHSKLFKFAHEQGWTDELYALL